VAALEEAFASPAGPYIAIFMMVIATYFCRASGVVFMSRVRVRPWIERALHALPGSIIVATILPIAAQSGLAAFVGIAAAVAAMVATRLEVVAIAVGLACVAGIRALGF
jgi:uncharacterized membrane protein